MTNVLKILLFSIFLISFFSIYGQIRFGEPEVISYFKGDNKLLNNQVWDIRQSKNGFMYFAMSDFFVEFDGKNWSEFVGDSSSPYFSFDIDATTGDFYIGAKHGLYKNQLNSGRYEKIEIPNHQSISNTWRTIFQDGTVYFFINKKEVIVYDSNNIELVRRGNNAEILRGFKINDIPYVVSKEYIGKLNGSQIILISRKYESIYKQDIRIMLEFTDNKILIGTKLGNFYIFNEKEDRFTYFNIAIPDLKENGVYSGVSINDSLFGITTLRKGFYIVNNYGEVKYHFDKSSGLNSDAVYCAYLDNKDNIWLGTGLGVNMINFGSSIRYLDKRNNVKELITSINFLKDKLLLSTSDGFYYADLNGRKQYFKEVSDKILYSEKGLKIFLSNKMYIIMSGYNGFYAYDENLTLKSKYNSFGALRVTKSPVVANRFFSVCSNKLVAMSLTEKNGKIEFELEKTFDDIPMDIDNIEFDRDNNLWVCQGKNLFLVDFDASESLDNYNIIAYDETVGLENDLKQSIFDIDGDIVISTGRGLYKVVDRDKSTSLYTFEKYEQGVLRIAKDDQVLSICSYKGHYFVQTLNKIYKINAQTNKVDMLFFNNIFDHWSADCFIHNDLLWTFSSNKIMCINPLTFNNFVKNKNNLILREVRIGSKINEKIYATNDFIRVLDTRYIIEKKIKRTDDIDLTFILPEYLKNDNIKYTYHILNGGKSKKIETTNNRLLLQCLEPGEYIVTVYAINAYREKSNEVTVSFTVSENILLSRFFIFIYLLIILLIIFTIYFVIKNTINSSFKKLKEELEQSKKQIQEQEKKIKLEARKHEENKKALKKEEIRLHLINVELKQLSLVATRTTNSVLILQKSGKVEWWNRGFTDLFAYKIEKYKDLPVKLRQRKIRPDVYKEITGYTKDRGTINYTNHEKYDNGEEIWYQTTINPIFDENGNLFKFVIIDINITDIKSAEFEILNYKKEQSELKEKYTELSVIHDREKVKYSEIKRINEHNIIYAELLNRYFSNQKLELGINIRHFIFSRSKDKLSGDFVWSKPYNNGTLLFIRDSSNNKVQDIMVRTISIALIDSISKDLNVYSVSKILNLYFKKISTLCRNIDEFEEQQVVPLALLFIDLEKQKLEMSGSNIPLYLIRKKHQFNLYTYDTFSRKSDFRNINSVNHTIQIENNDTIYLTTNGFVNQFEKLGQKRYTVRKLKNFIINVQDHKFEKHSELFEKEFYFWKGNSDLIDDVLIFGAKFIIHQ